MSETAISVAMATYNGERFLREQLESLARQSLLPLELIVCDDGSTDGTLDILHRFAVSAPFSVKIYQNETRLGSGFNFLRALGRCTGDLVAFCDQDDVWKEQKLSVCLDVMRDPGVTLVSHSAGVFSSQQMPRRWRHPDHRTQVWRSCNDFAVQRWTLLGFSMVLRRDVLNRVPIPLYSADLSPVCAHDVWSTIAALSCGRVVLLPNELAAYRLHESNVTLHPPASGLARLAPDPISLERGAGNYAGLAEFLRYAASFCNESVSRVFQDYIRQAESYSRACSERSRLHQACGHRWRAINILARMLAKGNYAPRSLGAKAFVRDALLAGLWQTNGPMIRDDASISTEIPVSHKPTVHQQRPSHRANHRGA